MAARDDCSAANNRASRDGFFAPDSVSWKVVGHPVALVGGMRALIVQALHPLAMAGVAQYSDFRRNPMKRLRGTSAYVAALVFGDRNAALAAVARVKALHERVRGVDPVTRKPFSANDPETMLWVHCVEIHSFLAAYRAYAGHLTLEQRDRYLAEQAVAAELIGIPSDMIPRSTAEYRRYFARVRPQLCLSAEAAETIDFVVRPKLSSDVPADLRVVGRVFGSMAAALVPRELRRLAGLPNRSPRELPSWMISNLVWRSAPLAARIPLLREAHERMASRIVGETPVRLASNAQRIVQRMTPSSTR
ncbi:hypothetical protein AKJ09_04941 [Labilithrix luteola]|uniref:ER-bound oxygenase mpaB/mpaB'/Rubber oxygenase catalytic domain-containing protein n=1 Tax=Labilithrix luteola TaxID=1391654 RepID=A0A0K1PXP5_9BACT|nr:oxygenase MpaB family protein [Labilithrix luteola]AKU98277.1 hypothetical protein AKJ09_04941 [Labilithrix luteola]